MIEADDIEGEIEQPAKALLTIRLAIGPLPALALIIGMVLTILYPVTRESHRRVVQIDDHADERGGNLVGELPHIDTADIPIANFYHHVSQRDFTPTSGADKKL